MEERMGNYRPSRFDRMLEKADEIIREGFAFLTDEEVPPFEDLPREWHQRFDRPELGRDD
jgi:hypothetical protein